MAADLKDRTPAIAAPTAPAPKTVVSQGCKVTAPRRGRVREDAR